MYQVNIYCTKYLSPREIGRKSSDKKRTSVTELEPQRRQSSLRNAASLGGAINPKASLALWPHNAEHTKCNSRRTRLQTPTTTQQQQQQQYRSQKSTRRRLAPPLRDNESSHLLAPSFQSWRGPAAAAAWPPRCTPLFLSRTPMPVIFRYRW